MFNYIWLIKDINEALNDWYSSSALWPALIGFLSRMRGINRLNSKEAEALLSLSSPTSIAAECNYGVEAKTTFIISFQMCHHSTSNSSHFFQNFNTVFCVFPL